MGEISFPELPHYIIWNVQFSRKNKICKESITKTQEEKLETVHEEAKMLDLLDQL